MHGYGLDSSLSLRVLQNFDRAALNGQLDKLQFQGIDSVVTGPLTSGKEQARAQRKGLNKAAAALSADIKALHADLAAALDKAGTTEPVART